MDKRERLERIILGTLLRDSDLEHYPSCKYCITEEMFDSDIHKDIYALITNAAKFGGKSSLYDLFVLYPDKVSDLCPYIANLTIFEDFEVKKMNYNEEQWLKSLTDGVTPNYSSVVFDDYVSEFIKCVFKP